MVSLLSPEQLTQFRELLDSRVNELAEDIRLHLEQYKNPYYAGLAGQVGDLEDHALADLLVDHNLATIHREIEEFRAIQAALRRIALGTYGVCVDCGDEISIERLKVYPTASRCYACQEVYEHTYSQSGHPLL